jgi:hypothetical protein
VPIILGSITSGRSTNITDGPMVIINHETAARPGAPVAGEDVNIAADAEYYAELAATDDDDFLAGLLDEPAAD